MPLNRIPTSMVDGLDEQLADMAQYFKPTGTTDDTSYIQNAINNNPLVVFKSGTYNISGTTHINVPSNVTIIFEYGAVFQVISNTASINYCLYINNVSNVTIFNPTIIGDRTTSTGSMGAAHGICITGTSSNIRIYNPNCSNFRGDGFVIYGGSDIYVENLFSNNNCRMGLTITNGKDIKVINPICTNSNGQAPQAGIDLEPNYSTDELQNIYISNPITKNNLGAGITMHLEKLNGQSHEVSIEIDSFKDYSSLNGLNILTLPTPSPVLRGTIRLNGVELHENANGAFLFQNYSATGTPFVEIIGLKIFNCNTSNQSRTNGSALILSRTDSSTYTMGNLNIQNLYISDDRSPVLTPEAIYQNDTQSAGFVKVVIDGVRFIGLDGLTYDYGAFPNASGFVCLDKWNDRIKYVNDTTGDYDCWMGYPTVIYNNSTSTLHTVSIRNVGAETWREVTFIHEGTGGGTFKIVPTGCTITGLTTIGGNYIQTTAIGSSITLRKITSTQFMVVKQTGTWTSQG